MLQQKENSANMLTLTSYANHYTRYSKLAKYTKNKRISLCRKEPVRKQKKSLQLKNEDVANKISVRQLTQLRMIYFPDFL